MKFTGQVRIPEIDHPGVPATIVVEGDQAEVFLEGETLGRWSLYDVHAARLVSSAFSIALANEEITFIADEPVDFAYKGVDHMAEVWARYKSMTIPRRVVSVGRSRRGTLPSRISELREAMLQNLDSARGTTRLAPIERVMESPPEPSSWTKRIDAYSSVPEPLEVDEHVGALSWPEPAEETVLPVVEILSADDRVAAVVEPPRVEDPAPAPEPSEEETGEDATPTRARLRPGPGLIRRRVDRPPSVGQPVDVEAKEGSRDDEDQPELGPEPAETTTPDSSAHVESPPGPGLEAPPAELPAEAEAPAPLMEPSPAMEVEEEARPEVVVDLDHLEEEDDEPGSTDDLPPEGPGDLGPEKEPVFAGAPAPVTERSGLLGAVRSAFARNRTPHVHEFVEAPGGIGIVRQICAECGYISIGVSD